jgi:hypothetical protein
MGECFRISQVINRNNLDVWIIHANAQEIPTYSAKAVYGDTYWHDNGVPSRGFVLCQK